MEHPRFTKEEIAAKGASIYEETIRDKVEPEHIGEYVVIDISPEAMSSTRMAPKPRFAPFARTLPASGTD